jgi:hypothetical protein
VFLQHGINCFGGCCVFNMSQSGSLQIGNLTSETWLSVVYVLWISFIVSFDCTIRDGHRFYNSMVPLQFIC